MVWTEMSLHLLFSIFQNPSLLLLKAEYLVSIFTLCTFSLLDNSKYHIPNTLFCSISQLGIKR